MSNIVCLAPEHVRANNNKLFYETVIQNRTTTEQRTHHSLTVDSYLSNVNRSSYIIHNERTYSDIDNHEQYEELCRQNRSQVRVHVKCSHRMNILI
jgi:hypothetical protein